MKRERLRRLLLRFLRWLLNLVFLMLGVSFFTFTLMSFAPGDPAEILLTGSYEAPSPEAVDAMKKKLGTDAPFCIRYAKWLGRAIRLDLGRSCRTGDPVAQALAERIPATLTLAGATLAFTIFFSLIAGLSAALNQGQLTDRLFRIGTVISVAVPDYWLGMVLVYFFSVKLGWFPVMGRTGAASLVLPVITLGLSIAAVHGRIFRASLIKVISSDYIRFARVKGVPFFPLFRRHILKNALLPVLTLWGISLGHLLGGAVIVESLFAWPGIGKLTVDAVLERDFPLVQGPVLFMALAFVLVSQTVDGLTRLLDPRISGNTGP